MIELPKSFALKLPKIPTLSSFSLLDLSRVIGMVISVGAIVIAASITFFISWPQFSQVLQLREANIQMAEFAAKLDLKAQKLEGLDQKKLESHLTNAEQMIPSQKDIFPLIRQIETNGITSGILLNRLDVSPGVVSADGSSKDQNAPPPTPSEAGVTAPKIVLKILMTSDYNSFLQFLNRILSVPRAVIISDLGISAGASTTGSVQIRTSFTVNAYWQSLPNQLPSIETPVETLSSADEELLAKANLTVISSAPPILPSIPVGKTNIFTPFAQ